MHHVSIGPDLNIEDLQITLNQNNTSVPKERISWMLYWLNLTKKYDLHWYTLNFHEFSASFHEKIPLFLAEFLPSLQFSTTGGLTRIRSCSHGATTYPVTVVSHGVNIDSWSKKNMELKNTTTLMHYVYCIMLLSRNFSKLGIFVPTLSNQRVDFRVGNMEPSDLNL